MNRSSFLLAAAAFASSPGVAAAIPALPKRRVSGIVVSVIGNTLVLQKRNGQTVTADLTIAAANQQVGILTPSVAVILHGTYLANGVFQCNFTSHAGPRKADWETDQ